MEVAWIVLLVIAAVGAVPTPVPKWPPYAFQEILDDNMFLFWTPNRTSNVMTFEIQARAKGFVGFGLAPGAGMSGADIVVGWVKDGKGYLQDMYATSNSKPLLDPKQNWNLLNSDEKDGVTSLRFSRPFDTGDCENDRIITDDTTMVIWAFSDSDELIYHEATNRGEDRIQLLDNSNFPQANVLPADAKTFEMRMPNVTIPANKTTLYWCQAFPIADVPAKHHIVKYELLIDKVEIAHHIIVHPCYAPISNVAMFKTGFDCTNMESIPPELNCPGSVMGWAVGGDYVNDYPPQAGLSIGTADDMKFAVMELHYNNVQGKVWTDQTGMRVTYTPTLRPNDVGMLVLGILEAPGMMIIPPKFVFTAHGICPESATRKFIPVPDGLHVFAFTLHAHLLGRKIRVRHIRNGIQIGWLGKDEHYDFDYQQSRVFNTERIVMAGDTFITECVYDSSNRDTVTYGGRSTLDEMCVAYLSYYPRAKTLACFSAAVPQNQVSIFNASVVIADNGTVINPANYRGKPFPALFNGAVWNDDLSQRLQSVQTRLPHLAGYAFPNKTFVREMVPYPVFNALSIEDGSCSTSSPTGASTATTTKPIKSSACSTTACASILAPLLIISLALSMRK